MLNFTFKSVSSEFNSLINNKTLMTVRVQIDLHIKHELAALIDIVLEQTGLNMEEVINRAIFHYYPEIFLASDIEQVITWIFFDNREQYILSKITECYEISAENLFFSLFELTNEEKTI